MPAHGYTPRPYCSRDPLRLPRRDIVEYSFVLRPLADIAPALVHPVTRRTIGEHWREFDGERHPLTPVPDIL